MTIPLHKYDKRQWVAAEPFALTHHGKLHMLHIGDVFFVRPTGNNTSFAVAVAELGFDEVCRVEGEDADTLFAGSEML